MTRRLGQWVSFRKILRFRVRLQLSQSRCLSLLLAMSGRGERLDKIRLHGRRGKGMVESCSREKSRHAPQKEGG